MAVFVEGEGLFILFVLKDDACFVVAGVAGLQLAGEEGRDIKGFAGRFAMIVRAVAEWKEAEAVDDREGYRAGIAIAALEPAKRAGAAAGQDDAFVIGFAQDSVDTLGFPDRDHVQGVASAHDNGVHVQQLSFEGLLIRSAIDPYGECVRVYGEVVTEAVPIVDPIGVVGRGCRQEADLRVGFAGKCDDLFDKSFLQCAAEGEDGAGLGMYDHGE